MKLIKRISLGFVVLILLVFTIVIWHFYRDGQDKYLFGDYDKSQIPQFEEVDVPFVNRFHDKLSLPTMASALIDFDGDGVDELFVGGGIGQKDAILKFEGTKFIDVSETAGLTKDLAKTTQGAAVIDMTQDGKPDLLVAREGEVDLYVNENGKFSKPQNLNLTFNEKSNPMAITIADLNYDGWADLFVSTYLKKNLMEGQTIFNKKDYGSTSELFLNNGDNTFRNITKESGLQYVHNTFSAVFVDLNNDNLPDLVVAHDTGEPRIYKNTGNLKFVLVNNPLTGKFSYPMGIAVGDYDNNGFQDVFFSNVGKTMPSMMLRGDLNPDQELITDMILLSNDGHFNFTNQSMRAKVDRYEFSWGAIFEDFNLDGLQDLVISENYVDLPNSKLMPLPSRFLMQLPDHTFVNIEYKNNTRNPYFGITPMASDFNNDGYPDLVHINLNGKVRAFINKANTGNNYLKVILPNTPKYINARVILTKADNQNITIQRVIGEGLTSDQTSTLFFGLGKDQSLPKLNLALTNGETRDFDVAKINTTLKIQ